MSDYEDWRSHQNPDWKPKKPKSVMPIPESEEIERILEQYTRGINSLSTNPFPDSTPLMEARTLLTKLVVGAKISSVNLANESLVHYLPTGDVTAWDMLKAIEVWQKYIEKYLAELNTLKEQS